MNWSSWAESYVIGYLEAFGPRPPSGPSLSGLLEVFAADRTALAGLADECVLGEGEERARAIAAVALIDAWWAVAPWRSFNASPPASRPARRGVCQACGRTVLAKGKRGPVPTFCAGLPSLWLLRLPSGDGLISDGPPPPAATLVACSVLHGLAVLAGRPVVGLVVSADGVLGVTRD